MAEKRLPACNLTLLRGREGVCKVEIFRKSQWTGDSDDDTKYRLRINGRWVNGTHGQRSYVTRDGIVNEVVRALASEGIV